jgi:hypothetical protein
MLVDELVRVQNASFIAQRAEFAATNATLTQASTGLTSGFAGLRHELGQRFDALDRNMTGDHVRLYEGVYVTDPKDPYYKLPAHHAVLVGEKTIAENQVVSHNASQARFESLTSALAASVQAQATLATAMQGHETHAAATAEDVSFLAGKQGWNRGLLYVMIVVILVPMAYLFGPDVVQRIRLQRARIPILPAARDDGLPTEEEMDTLRAEARERGDAEPDSPAASAPSSPRRRLVVSAPEPEAL